MQVCTKVHAANLVRWAADKPRVLVLSADLTSSCEADAFRDAYPDRFVSMGIAEQNMVSFAAGLAREGWMPLVHTFAVFICRRAYDQVAMSVAYANAPVKLIGFLPGITTPGGASHQAIDDVALMRQLPNMTVLEPGDATEVESVLDVMAAVPGPVYVRMLRGEVPRLFPADQPLCLDQPRVLSEGDDLSVFSTGICTEEALKAVAFLQARGLGVTHLHLSTLKPCTHPSVRAALERPRLGCISMENHLRTGGLGTVLAEAMADAGLGKRLVRLGLDDTFAHGGSRGYLMREHGLDAAALLRAASTLVGRPLHASPGELAAARTVALHSAARVEAL
ncbi:MAG: transketolase [Deltaproteobacteria bacterium]|nr:transketolase [Deltaproteobacteria bacterium]